MSQSEVFLEQNLPTTQQLERESSLSIGESSYLSSEFCYPISQIHESSLFPSADFSILLFVCHDHGGSFNIYAN